MLYYFSIIIPNLLEFHPELKALGGPKGRGRKPEDFGQGDFLRYLLSGVPFLDTSIEKAPELVPSSVIIQKYFPFLLRSFLASVTL